MNRSALVGVIAGQPSPAATVAAPAPDVALTADPDAAPNPADQSGKQAEQAPGPYRGRVLRTVSWLMRAAAFILIGVEAFHHATVADRTALVVMACAYGFYGLLMVIWGLIDARGGAQAARDAAVLPVLFGGMTAVSGFACTYPHGASLLGLALLAALTAGSETSLPAGWAVTACGVLAIEAGALVTGAGRGVILGYPLALLVGLLAGHNRRAYRVRAEQNAALLARAEDLRAEQRRNAVLDERARIAREIHDVLAHSLGALNIQIQTARSLLAHQEPERADDILAKSPTDEH